MLISQQMEQKKLFRGENSKKKSVWELIAMGIMQKIQTVQVEGKSALTTTYLKKCSRGILSMGKSTAIILEME